MSSPEQQIIREAFNWTPYIIAGITVFGTLVAAWISARRNR